MWDGQQYRPHVFYEEHIFNGEKALRPVIYMKARIDWIDVSRGIAFLMVIYSHLPMMNNQVMIFFSPVFLTTFFFISGYLFKSGQKFSVVLEHRLRTLLLPFLVLGLLMLLMEQIVTFNEKTSLTEGLKGLLFQNGENEILWFIAALFVYSVIFYWIDWICRTPKQLLWFSIVLFIINSIALHWFDMPAVPWHLFSFGCACFYMALGRLYRIYEAKFDSMINGWILAVCIVVYAGYIYISQLYIGHSGSKAVIDSMLITLIGLVILITISKRYIHNSRFLLFVGANTLFYFAFHGKVYSLILFGINKTVPTLLENNSLSTDLFVAFAIVLVDALILIPPTKIVNRYCPQILGRNFKLWGTKRLFNN